MRLFRLKENKLLEIKEQEVQLEREIQGLVVCFSIHVSSHAYVGDKVIYSQVPATKLIIIEIVSSY